MYNCPTCNTELPSDHPARAVGAILNFVKDNSWTVFDNYKEGQRVPISGFDISIAAIKTTYDTGDVDVESYYGESALPQGSEFEAFIVFKVGDSYYKKTGTGDSYGDVDWDGDLRQVTATPKTILEFK
jgi:hypothetical protein